MMNKKQGDYFMYVNRLINRIISINRLIIILKISRLIYIIFKEGR